MWFWRKVFHEHQNKSFIVEIGTFMTLLPCLTTKTVQMSFCTIWTVVTAIFKLSLNQNRIIPFLNVLVTCIQNNTFMTSICRKKTFTGLFTKWDSFAPRKYKINLIRSLTYRYYCAFFPYKGRIKSHWLEISRIAGQIQKIENPETLPQERF